MDAADERCDVGKKELPPRNQANLFKRTEPFLISRVDLIGSSTPNPWARAWGPRPKPAGCQPGETGACSQKNSPRNRICSSCPKKRRSGFRQKKSKRGTSHTLRFRLVRSTRRITAQCHCIFQTNLGFLRNIFCWIK